MALTLFSNVPGNKLIPTIDDIGVANGIASLDSSGKISTAQLPTTTDIVEGSNLYFTNIRVDSRVQSYTGDITLTGSAFAIGASKVTNTMLAGSIANNKLSNSTISGIALGSNLNTLTIGTGLTGTSYNGSTNTTIAIDSTVVTTTGVQNITNKKLGSLTTNGFVKTSGSDGTLSVDTTTYGTGSVSSVGISLPSIFSVSGSPVTTSGTLTGTLASQSQNLVLASPDGSSGTPTFRSIVNADLPTRTATVVTRSLNSSFQISTTLDYNVSYSVLISISSLLTGNNVGTVFLETSPNNSTWTTICTSGLSLSGLAATITNTQTVNGFVPKTYYVRIRTTNSGTGSQTLTYQNGQENSY